MTRESALTFVIDVPGLDDLPYMRRSLVERGLVPHLTVLYPWHPVPLASSSIEQAAEAVAGTGTIHARFDRIETFPSGVVYAAMADPDAVIALMQRVFAAFPETPPYGGEHPSPVPHLTLAQCDPPDLAATRSEVEAQTAGLLPFAVEFAALGILEQDEAGRWSVTGEVSLL